LPFFDPGPKSNPVLRSSGGAERPLELAFGPAVSGGPARAETPAWNLLLAGRKRWFVWPSYCTNTGFDFGMPVQQWAREVLPALRGLPCAPIEFEQGPDEVRGWAVCRTIQ